MPRITLKETITRKFDIPIDTLVEIINNLNEDDKQNLLSRIERPVGTFNKHKKAKLSRIIKEFAETQLYEPEFLSDLEEGLKKSSLYR